MNKPIIYLAGPIAGKTWGEATNWRLRVSIDLRVAGCIPLSPMRAKEGLKGDLQISKDHRAYANYGPFYTSQGIITRDFTDVKRCDALLVNLLGCQKLTTGTVMELGWAYAMQKPVVAVIEPTGNVHDTHPMVKEVIGGLRFDDLDDAVAAVLTLVGV